jgi:EAL domain-containing protein (putative c-di-GMP-specific phosphodiesterase class I)
LALGRGQFRVLYQPIVDACGRVAAHEALLRWLHPQHALLEPARFLHELMATGHLGDVGMWVLGDAIGSLADTSRRHARRPTPLHVNLSPVEIADARLAERLEALLDTHGVDPDLLTIEVTEHTLGGGEVSMSSLRDLAATGVRLALDDFGTGASSLSHLRHRPLHAVKLDQSFIRGLDRDPCDRTIVHGTIAMARQLGLDVIAEGVETIEQHRWLVAHGCTHLQGFYHGRPQPRVEV